MRWPCLRRSASDWDLAAHRWPPHSIGCSLSRAFFDAESQKLTQTLLDCRNFSFLRRERQRRWNVSHHLCLIFVFNSSKLICNTFLQLFFLLLLPLLSFLFVAGNFFGSDFTDNFSLLSSLFFAITKTLFFSSGWRSFTLHFQHHHL